MIRRLYRRRLKRDGEEGLALIMVISIGAVLTILVATGVTYALGGFRKANTDEAWSAAMAAAYAGVEEYQSRLANDSTYVKYGNPSSLFTSGTGSSVIVPTEANPAFGIGTAGTWATVPRDPAADVNVKNDPAQFRYEVDNSKYSTTGTLRIRSTGKVGKSTRTIVADLRQQGFIDFLYFTNYEISDPAFTSVNSACVKYKWAGRPDRDTANRDCSEIQFGTNDVIAGPVHSNDTIRVCASRFKDTFTTSNPTSGLKYTSVTGCGAATFDLAANGYPAYSPPLTMPASNGALIQETRSDVAALNSTLPGCLFTGPTSIEFFGNGTMTVRSPYTLKTNIVGSPATSGSVSASCGTPGVQGLGSALGQNIPVPDNNVIYVQSVPTKAAGSSDPNAWDATGSNSKPAQFNCKGLPTTGSNSTTPDGNGIGYPTTNEPVSATITYGCRSGDVFVKGKLDGNVTVGADNYIFITGELTYEDSNDDMLGLVGNNAVIVWNPEDRNNKSLLTDSARRIDAAILSVNHTFTVQNYENGDYRGVLTINGAIAQQFRGPVGLAGNSSGYSKAYEYDKRMRYTAPPKFLSPVSTTYGVNTWVETNVAFAADGSPR
ncbi:hypothetical protein HD599_000129 [Conyzicola lurida]|uniref:Uncharacterized protein n=1 Tax=Conyzicola lurida TaxID=1172621 RepID=A0A841AJ92_9MICO|nr:hypothetical protein [Conyzicola lurida]MBB5841806.1 hypothetical protein [Conyzicola lurida]